jgi:hypothetical protein
MRRVYTVLLGLALGCHLVGLAWAKEFKLMDGTVITGEVSAFDDNGAVFRLQTGGFSPRYAWMKFTQETLKQLAENEKIKPMVDPFIEIPPEAKPKPKPIFLREVPRAERPIGRTTMFSSFTAPLGLVVLGLLYAVNLFAAYEISHYRNRPVPLVCGLSALMPLLGPLIFLASPTVPESGEGAAPLEEGPPDMATPGPAVAVAASPHGTTSRRIGSPPPPPPGGGLRVAAAQKAGGGKLEPKVYSRAEYTFNRRFIETQFAGFFRVVPSEAEKDLVLVFKTPKHEYVGRRISRISSNEFFLQLQQGGGTKEVSITFGEIAQIIVRHKDDQPD